MQVTHTTLGIDPPQRQPRQARLHPRLQTQNRAPKQHPARLKMPLQHPENLTLLLLRRRQAMQQVHERDGLERPHLRRKRL